MDLTNAQLGDRYRIFLTAHDEVTDKPGMKTILATVIAKRRTGGALILGWKKDEARPADTMNRSNTASENDYVPDQALYVFGKQVAPTCKVAVKIVNGQDGFPCRKCGNFILYALPNRPDGTFLCYPCRTGY